MPEKEFFAFFKHRYKMASEQRVFNYDKLEDLLKLVRELNDPIESNVEYLTVVYGYEVKFEPVERVTEWRIKDEDED